ncbi:hypothetical protein OG897_13505 [Streptomyces sp. NBC_00237]|nr:hypothetical protein [Streptomyces sp. NBC_00237]MCX5202460.1 hypothetical protein [Streptomyces sp. NBC_00237]
MIDLLVAAVAAALFALWLRARYAVLLVDGLGAAVVLFVIYIVVAAQVR